MSDQNIRGGFPILAVLAILVVIVTGLGFVGFFFVAAPSVSVSAPVTSSTPVTVESTVLPAKSDEVESVPDLDATTGGEAASSSN